MDGLISLREKEEKESANKEDMRMYPTPHFMQYTSRYYSRHARAPKAKRVQMNWSAKGRKLDITHSCVAQVQLTKEMILSYSSNMLYFRIALALST